MEKIELPVQIANFDIRLHLSKNDLFDLSDKISVLVYGEIICSDTPANVRNNKEVKEAYLGNYGN